MAAADHFDVLICGTGLAECITAAVLSKAGCSVLHVDSNDYYGGNEASLTPRQLEEWARKDDAIFTHKLATSAQGLDSRQYSISLAPSIIPATGSLISSLIDSGVSRYSGFRLLERIGVYSSGSIHIVPWSKEDIFKSKDISLVDKRRLMRFLSFTAGDFETAPELAGREEMPFVSFLEEVFQLNENLRKAVAFALAFCHLASDPTLPALKRIRLYLKSSGRYGPSPFLIAEYGGLGELVQGFARACAVSGGTYILDSKITKLEVIEDDKAASVNEASKPSQFRIMTDKIDHPFLVDAIIASSQYLPHDLTVSGKDDLVPNTRSSVTLMGLAVIDQRVSFERSRPDLSVAGDSEIADHGAGSDLDCALLVFPPESLTTNTSHGSVFVLFNGDATNSCPPGKQIVYLSTTWKCKVDMDEPNPQTILHPYLDEALKLACPVGSPNLLFKMFYTLPDPLSTDQISTNSSILVPQQISSHFALRADSALNSALLLFQKLTQVLPKVAKVPSMWPELELDYVENE